MAKTLWGKVYYGDNIYVGRLQEEPGGRMTFGYDPSYLDSKNPPIAHTLPLQTQPFISESGLHPFFDNLVAEGWFRNAQAKVLGLDPNNRFGLLLGFGHDLAGMVSIVDPEPQQRGKLDYADDMTKAALAGRASLSGIQPKIMLVKDGQIFRPVLPHEISTHIAKLVSGNLTDILEVEYLTTLAVKTLLPEDEIVSMEIREIEAIGRMALIIPRFDRGMAGKRTRHFEEMNQLLGKMSGDKYQSSYEEMGRFILETPGCIPAEANRLFQRILACFITGNTDAHLKNFAMFHTRDGLRLTPLYDLVASSVYPDFQMIALGIGGATDLAIGEMKPKLIVAMANGFRVDGDEIMLAINGLEKRLPKAFEAITQSQIGGKELKDKLIGVMEKRWSGSFASIGQLLSKRQDRDAKA